MDAAPIAPALNSFDAAQLFAVLATKTDRLRAIIDHLPVILGEVDSQGRFSLCAGDGLRLLGRRPEDFVGRTIAQVYPDHPQLIEDHRRALAGSSFSTTVELGGRTWHTTYEPVRSSNGQGIGFRSISLDVTETVRSDAERRASDARLHLLTRSLPIVLFAADCNEVITLAEGNGFAHVGLDPSMLVGHTLEECFPDVAPTVRVHHQRVLAGEEFAATVVVGGRTWDMRYVPMRDAQGEVVGLCGVGLDVTDRMRSERDLEAIRRREADMAELSRAALAGAAVSDLIQAAVTLVARELPGVEYAGVGEITEDGLRRITAVGIPDGEAPVTLSPEPLAYAAMQSVHAGQSVIVTDWDKEKRFSQPDWLQLEAVNSSAFPPIITHPSNHIFGFLGAHARQPRVFPEHEIAFLETVANLLGDVIARQQAQDAALQQAEQFRALVENSSDIVSRFDRDLRMVYVNGTVERLTGVPAAKLVGRTSREAGMQEPQVSALELALRQVLDSGTQRVLEYDAQTVLGERTFQARIAPEFSAEGTVQSLVVATVDITDRQRADQERMVVYKQLLAQQENLHQLTARLIDRHHQELEQVVTEIQLSQRERQILRLIARGWTNREIAAELHVSRGNVKNQVSRLLAKLDVSDRTQAAAQAVRFGLVEKE